MIAFAKDLPKLRAATAEILEPRRQHEPRARARLRAAAARPRLLPDRLRGLRRHQRDLRPGDDAQGARQARGRRHDGLRLHGQVRQAPRPGRRRPAAASRSSPRLKRRRGGRRGAARLQGRPRAGATSSSPDINAFLKEITGGDHSRQGLPHLERDAARRGRAGRQRRGGGHQDGPQARHRPRRQGGLPLPRQHARRLPRVLHRPARDRRLPGRRHRRPGRDRRRGSDEDVLPIHQRAVERAVLRLLDGHEAGGGLSRSRPSSRSGPGSAPAGRPAASACGGSAGLGGDRPARRPGRPGRWAGPGRRAAASGVRGVEGISLMPPPSPWPSRRVRSSKRLLGQQGDLLAQVGEHPLLLPCGGRRRAWPSPVSPAAIAAASSAS